MNLTAVATEIPLLLWTHEDSLQGLFSIIWASMRTKFNFSLSTLGTMDFGHLYSDKNGSGIFGTLIRNETQFSVVPMYLTENAVLLFDYTTILVTDEWAIISGPPQIFLTEYFTFLRSFETSLWKTLISVLILYALSWTVITQCVKQKWGGLDFFKSFGNYLFSSVIVLVNQYHYVKSKRLYERLCWSSWTIACMLLSLSFTGLLLAKLAKKNDPFRYETLAEILQDPNMKLLLVENTPPYDDIKTSNDPAKIKIWNKVNQEKTVKKMADLNFENAFSDMARGKLAFMSMTRGFLTASTKMCGTLSDVYIAKKPYIVTMFSLYMRKELDFEIRNTIKYVSRQIAESHVLQTKLEFLEYMGRLCITSMTPEITPLILESLIFIFYSYIFCMICALTALAMEHSIYRRLH